ncbi:Clostridial hydrophobic W [anaerobic digester metagenome]
MKLKVILASAVMGIVCSAPFNVFAEEISADGSERNVNKIVESGYIGVSSSVSVENTTSVDVKTAPLQDVVSPAVRESVAPSLEVTAPVEATVPSSDAVASAVETPTVVSEPATIDNSFLDSGSAVVCPLPERGDRSTMGVSSSESESLTTMVDPAYAEYYDIWKVQGSVSAVKIARVLELINAERVKYGQTPLKLDQKLTKNALIRAGENNIYFNHSRPGGGFADYIRLGNEIISVSGTTPEDTVNAWINSGGHHTVLLANYSTYIGIGQVNNSWVCVFGGSEYNSSYKPADSAFLKTLETSNRIDDVVVAHEILQPKIIPTYVSNTIENTINKGQTKQLGARIKTDYWEPVNNYAQVVPSSMKWTSSNPKIASVDANGLVTGVSQGNVTITGTVNGQTVTYNLIVSSSGTTPVTEYLVKYRTHVQNVGWQDYVADGAMSGTSGRSLRLEGINISIDPSIGGGIEYRTHVQNIGWQGYVSNGAMSGTSGMSYRLEAINIRLTGAAAEKYDIYYRVHTQNIGWMGWAKNGEASGSAGFGYRLEGIEIQLVAKGGPAPGSTANAFVEAGI